MSKPSQLDKAIASLDAEIAILNAAKVRLEAQRVQSGMKSWAKVRIEGQRDDKNAVKS